MKNCGSAVKNWDLTRKGDLTRKHGDLPIKHGGF
jgi:hypothetical protein